MALFHPHGLLAAMLWGALVGGLVLYGDRLGLTEPLELWAADQMAAIGSSRSEPVSEVTLLWIGEAEIQRYGHPLSDSSLAKVLSAILQQQPAAVGVDLYRDQPRPPGSDALQRVLLDTNRVFLAQKLADERSPGIAAPAYLPTAQVGFSDVPVDQDGTLRRLFLMLWDDSDRAYLSLPLRVALRYLQEQRLGVTAHADNPEWLQLGLQPMPPLATHFGGYGPIDDRGYQYLFDSRPVAGLGQYSVTQLLQGTVPESALRGHMVFLATAAPSVKDQFQTALAVSEYGGLVHGLAADQLVRIARGEQAPTRAWSDVGNALWILAWALLAALIVALVSTRQRQVGLWLTALATLIAAVYLARRQELWLLLSAPLLALTLSALGVWSLRAWADRRDKSALYALFGRFVSIPVLEEVWRDREGWSAGRMPEPRLAPVTILVADLSGFSERVNSMPPDRLMSWMGQFMEAMAKEAERHGGVVNDFTGDGVMVNFGAPVLRDNPVAIAGDAKAAMACAQGMCEALNRLNRDWSAERLPSMRMRIGIASGTAVAGAYGSLGRMKYTTIGPPINLAARLEAYDKSGFVEAATGHRVLVAQETAALVPDQRSLRPIEAATIKGFAGTTQIYRLELAVNVGSESDESAASENAVARYVSAS